MTYSNAVTAAVTANVATIGWAVVVKARAEASLQMLPGVQGLRCGWFMCACACVMCVCVCSHHNLVTHAGAFCCPLPCSWPVQDLPAVLAWLSRQPSVTWLSPRMESHIHNLYATSIIQVRMGVVCVAVNTHVELCASGDACPEHKMRCWRVATQLTCLCFRSQHKAPEHSRH